MEKIDYAEEQIEKAIRSMERNIREIDEVDYIGGFEK